MVAFLFDRTSRRPGAWRFELYTDGTTPWATVALTNLHILCETHLPERFEIEVVDVAKDRSRARAAGVAAIPCVIRRYPAPVVRTGACRNLERLGEELGLRQVRERKPA